jgi:hypothetical protein
MHSFSFSCGSVLNILGPQAEGAENKKLVGQYLQLSILFYTLGGIPVVLVWSLWAESVISWLGFDEETARLGQAYAIPFNLKAMVLGINLCLNEFLLFANHETYSTISQTIQFVTQLIPIVLIATMTNLRDLSTIGYIQLCVAMIYLSGNWIFVLYQGWLQDYWEGLCHSWAMKVCDVVGADGFCRLHDSKEFHVRGWLAGWLAGCLSVQDRLWTFGLEKTNYSPHDTALSLSLL